MNAIHQQPAEAAPVFSPFYGWKQSREVNNLSKVTKLELDRARKDSIHHHGVACASGPRVLGEVLRCPSLEQASQELESLRQLHRATGQDPGPSPGPSPHRVHTATSNRSSFFT